MALLLLMLLHVCGRAFCWSSVIESEVRSLHSLYIATQGDFWIYDVNDYEIENGGQPWNFSLPTNDTDPCVDKWFGVKCTESAEICANQQCSITHLNLGSFNLQGSIPESLTDLTSLGRISLHYNALTGPLPSFLGSMTKLYYIMLSYNRLTSTLPESYKYLQSLQRFDVVNNFLTGTIPSSFGDFTALSILDMYDNLFSGTLPASIGANNRLRYVEIMRNSLWGPLPPEFGTRYTSFQISDNFFSGQLPASLLQHTRLDILYVDYNFLTGPMPDLIEPIRLEILNAEHNFISGTIPLSFSLFTELSTLDLSNNILSGPVPANMSIQNQEIHILDMSFNRLHGVLPAGLFSGDTIYVYLHHNKFSGTIPEDLLSVATRIELLTLYNNKFSGTVPASLGWRSTLTTLLLQDNLLTGHIGDIFRKANDLSLQPFQTLQLLDISSNRFSGSIPVEIFSLPNVRHVAIIENCFSGTIPNDICDATFLEGLLLEGLRSGEKCRDNVWDPAGLTNAYFTKGIKGSIPECIFSLPNLNTLHITGNRLSGTLPSSLNMTTLVDLKLSDNRLSGRIPQFLQEHIVASIDLSRNRFRGEFDLPKAGGQTTSLKLSVNRLSGHIASGFDSLVDVDVLKGNLFECKSRSDIPSRDPDSTTYVCGSDQFDAPLELWLVLLGMVVLLVVISLSSLYTHSYYDTSVLRYAANFCKTMWKYYSEWIAALTEPRVAVHTELLKFVNTLEQLRVSGAVIASIIVVSFGVIYYSLKAWGDYGSHVQQYRWLFTAAYLTGLLPALLMLSVLTALLFFLLRLTYINYDKLSKVCSQNKEDGARILQNTAENDSLVTVKSYGYIAAVSLLNVMLILFIKGVYVYLLIWQDISYSAQIAANIALSIFDVIWNAVIVTKAVSLFSPLVRNKIRIRWHLLLLLFNSIVAPMISAAITDRNCFVEIFVGRDALTSKSQYIACTDVTGSSCLSIDVVELSTTFTPAFSYSYQCMSSILMNFIPVFLFSHILLGFVFPSILVLCLWAFSSSRISGKIRKIIPHVLLPGLYHQEADPVHKLMRPGIIISSLLHHFAVMLTFGVAAPLLTVCIAWTIFVTTWIWQLVLGRFVNYHSKCASAATEEGHQAVLQSNSSSSDMLASLNYLCTDVWQGPLKAVWVMVDYSLLFLICLSVDIVGDVRGWLFAILCVGIPALCIMMLLRCIFRADIYLNNMSILLQANKNPNEALHNVSMVSIETSPMSHVKDSVETAGGV